MYDLITIGDIKLDTFIVLPEGKKNIALKDREKFLCVEYGGKIPVRTFEPQIAGSAPNIAVGAKRLGLRTAIFSMIGDDPIAELSFKTLKQEGVDTKYLQVVKGEKSSFSIVINYKGDRTILAMHRPHLYRLPKITKTKWFYVAEVGEKYEKLYKDVTAYVKKNKVKLAFNPGSIQIQKGLDTFKNILSVTELLFVNVGEARAILSENGKTPIHRLITGLWKLGPNTVVITDGKKGAYAFDGGDIYFLPAFTQERVETTGAGDSFGCGVTAALIYGKSLNDALVWGSLNATSVVKYVGPQAGLLARAQIEGIMRNHPEYKSKVFRSNSNKNRSARSKKKTNARKRKKTTRKS